MKRLFRVLVPLLLICGSGVSDVNRHIPASWQENADSAKLFIYTIDANTITDSTAVAARTGGSVRNYDTTISLSLEDSAYFVQVEIWYPGADTSSGWVWFFERTPPTNWTDMAITVTTGEVDAKLDFANDISGLNVAAGIVEANLEEIENDNQSSIDLKDFADAGYNPAIDAVVNVTTVTAQVVANVTAIAGNSIPADNLADDYDGTGYAKTFSTVGTATNLTTNNDKTGYALSPDGVASIADTVADTLNAVHGAGSWATATGFSTAANLTLAIDSINALLDTLQLWDTRIDSMEAALADASIGDKVWVDKPLADREVDVKSISDDVLAADSLEFGLDGVVETNRERLFLNLDATVSSRSSHAATAIVSSGAITTSGGAVTTVTNVTNQVTADITAISGDALAADSLEFGLDGVAETNRERLFTNLDEVISTRSAIGDTNQFGKTDIVSSGAITTSGGAVTTVTNVTNGVTLATDALNSAAVAATGSREIVNELLNRSADSAYTAGSIGDTLKRGRTGISTLAATDNIGINWGDVTNQGTSVNLSATTTNLVNTATTVTNDVTLADGEFAIVADSVWQADTANHDGVAGSYGATNTSPLRPTVNGRQLDITAGGNSGVDWNNVETPGATVALSATTVNLVTTTTTATNVTNDVTLADGEFALMADSIWQADTLNHNAIAGSFGEFLYKPQTASLTDANMAAIADSVWQADTLNHNNTVGSYGEFLYKPQTATLSDANMAAIADSVWQADTATHDGVAGSYGATNTSPLRPTVNGRQLDVTAAGEAGIDLDNTVGDLAASEIAANVMAEIADSVWEEDTTGHLDAGFYGLEATTGGAASITDADMGAISDSVWDKARADGYNIADGMGDFLRDTANSILAEVIGVNGLTPLQSSDNIGINWGDVSNQSTSVNLSATTTNLVNTATNLTTNNDKTGYALTDAAYGIGADSVWDHANRYVKFSTGVSFIQNAGFEDDTVSGGNPPNQWNLSGSNTNSLTEASISGGRWSYKMTQTSTADTNFLWQEVGNLSTGMYYMGVRLKASEATSAYLVLDNGGPTTTSSHIDSLANPSTLEGEIGFYFKDVSGSIRIGIRLQSASGTGNVLIDEFRLIPISLDTSSYKSSGDTAISGDEILAEVVNIDAWNPITDNDSLVVDQSTMLALQPTSAGQKLDVSVLGNAGVDFDNITGGLGATEIDANAIGAQEFAAVTEIMDSLFDTRVPADTTSGSWVGRVLTSGSAITDAQMGAIADSVHDKDTLDAFAVAGGFGKYVKDSTQGAAGSLDSGVVSRISHRVGWGTARGSGSDSSTLAERDVTATISGSGPVTTVIAAVDTSGVDQPISGVPVTVRDLAGNQIGVDQLTNSAGYTTWALAATDSFTAQIDGRIHNNTLWQLDSDTIFTAAVGPDTFGVGHTDNPTDSILMGRPVVIGVPGSAALTRVFGYVQNAAGTKVSGVIVTATLNGFNMVDTSLTPDVIVTPHVVFDTTDTNGYFFFDLVRTVNIEPEATYDIFGQMGGIQFFFVDGLAVTAQDSLQVVLK